MRVKTVKCKALRAARRAARLWEPDPIVLPELDAVTRRVIHYRWHDRAHNDGWRQPFATELEAWQDVLQFYGSTAYGVSDQIESACAIGDSQNSLTADAKKNAA